MTDNVDFSLFARQIEDARRADRDQDARLSAMPLRPGDAGGGGPTDLSDYRITLLEKQYDKLEAKIDGIHTDITAIRLAIGSLSTKDTARAWGLGLIAVVIATGIAMGAVLLQSSSNQLAAFQAGLSAVATVAGNPPIIRKAPTP